MPLLEFTSIIHTGIYWFIENATTYSNLPHLSLANNLQIYKEDRNRLINATLESYVSDGIYHKLENSTIYPLTSTMHNIAYAAKMVLWCPCII